MNCRPGRYVELIIGAGFYLNATAEKWKKHYNMYDLIVEEIPAVLKEADLGLVSPLELDFPDELTEQDFSRVSIMGHSMGGMSHFLLSQVCMMPVPCLCSYQVMEPCPST
jgi:S-formylglutathione hydrolase FrmB